MQTRALLGVVVECDPERTRAAYAGLPAIACAYLYCRNYVAACARLPVPVRALPESLGIDPPKGRKSSSSGALPAGPGATAASTIWPAGRLRDRRAGEPAHRGRIQRLFRRDLHLVPPGFSRPALQLEFNGTIPWVLAERP